MTKRMLIVTPHLSTGGLPQYLFWKIQQLARQFDVHLVEYQFASPDYVVQRNKIRRFLPAQRLFTLPNDDKTQLMDLVKEIKPHVVHFEEIPELFCDKWVAEQIYGPGKKALRYMITETTHCSDFDVTKKRFLPDKWLFVSNWSVDQYMRFSIPKSVLEYSCHRRTRGLPQILNVGLWTPGKDQAYAIELAKRCPGYQFHFVGNQAPNFEDYWKPLMTDLPKNCFVHGESDDVASFYQKSDLLLFTSRKELNPLVIKEALSFGLTVFMRNLETLEGEYEGNSNVHFLTGNADVDATDLQRFFENPYDGFIADFYGLEKEPKFSASMLCVHGPRVQLDCDPSRNYSVQIKDGKDVVVHEATVPGTGWVSAFREYFEPWKATITGPDSVSRTINMNLAGQRVYIALDSRALGDTIAWFPYVEEFRQKHDCKVICSTFWNRLFRDNYRKIEFIEPGHVAENIVAQYNVGCFSDPNLTPAAHNTTKIQKIAADILGLEFREIRPNIQPPPNSHPRVGKRFVAIATRATAQAKLWNHKDGWAEIVKRLQDHGFIVYDLSLGAEPTGAERLDKPSRSTPIVETSIDLLDHPECAFFIGLPSGLSWLAWALGKKVVMISGFSHPWCEFESNRIHVGPPAGKCFGCYTSPGVVFDKGDWAWCPNHKGTARHFECTTSITPEHVWSAIERAGLLKHEHEH